MDAARKELVVKAREQEVAEEEGWISSKLKFSEMAARTKEEAERDSWNAEFSRELIEAQTKLKDTERSLLSQRISCRKHVCLGTRRRARRKRNSEMKF